MRLALRAIDPGTLVSQLEAGEIDIALVSQAALPKGFPHQPLLQEKFMMAQRKRHPRGDRKPTLRDYARLDHVVVSGDGGGFRSFVDDILRDQGYQRRVVVSVQYYSLVPLILETTDLVCTLPARFLSRYADRLVSFPLPFDAGRFSLFATWHARFEVRSRSWLVARAASRMRVRLSGGAQSAFSIRIPRVQTDRMPRGSTSRCDAT